MATWTPGVRAAQRIIEAVEEALNDNSIYFREVTLYPFRTNGGRSNGVTAWFEYASNDETGQPNVRKHICISVYEHWNTDQIDVKISEYVPHNDTEKHDEPTVQFKCDQLQAVVCGIQLFLANYFDIPEPKEWYVPSQFKGNCVVSDEVSNAAEDLMMSAIMEFCNPEEKCGQCNGDHS